MPDSRPTPTSKFSDETVAGTVSSGLMAMARGPHPLPAAARALSPISLRP
jgi:hypothetical protein